MRRLTLVLVLGLLLQGGPPAAGFELAVPLDCEFGKECWIQQYPDHERAGAASDYKCGSESYRGHDGVDLRVRNTSSMVSVLAAAEGEVVSLRDGMPDVLANSEALLAAVKSRECGNGVLLRHADGYETQYCHMRMGSISVKVGDKVEAGTRLGEVGYSGAAAFPHLHLALRKDGQKLDPFAGPLASPCSEQAAQGYWTPAAAATLAYHESDLLELGFSADELDVDRLERGLAGHDAPQRDWVKLIGYARAINLKAGDELHMLLEGPSGRLAERSLVLDRDKAEFVQFLGIRIPQAGLPSGHYAVNAQLKRAGKSLWNERSEAELK